MRNTRGTTVFAEDSDAISEGRSEVLGSSSLPPRQQQQQQQRPSMRCSRPRTSSSDGFTSVRRARPALSKQIFEPSSAVIKNHARVDVVVFFNTDFDSTYFCSRSCPFRVLLRTPHYFAPLKDLLQVVDISCVLFCPSLLLDPK